MYEAPFWFQRSPIAGANPFVTRKWKAYNRTGGATTRYGVYQFDMGFSQAETLNFEWNDAGSCWRNIVASQTSGTGTGTQQLPHIYTGVYCVALAAVADNAELEVLVIGETPVLTVTNNATQFFPRWSNLAPVASQIYCNITAGNTSNSTMPVGRTLVGTDLGSTSVAAERNCLFVGFGVGT